MQVPKNTKTCHSSGQRISLSHNGLEIRNRNDETHFISNGTAFKILLFFQAPD